MVGLSSSFSSSCEGLSSTMGGIEGPFLALETRRSGVTLSCRVSRAGSGSVMGRIDGGLLVLGLVEAIDSGSGITSKLLSGSMMGGIDGGLFAFAGNCDAGITVSSDASGSVMGGIDGTILLPLGDMMLMKVACGTCATSASVVDAEPALSTTVVAKDGGNRLMPGAVGASVDA